MASLKERMEKLIKEEEAAKEKGILISDEDETSKESFNGFTATLSLPLNIKTRIGSTKYAHLLIEGIRSKDDYKRAVNWAVEQDFPIGFYSGKSDNQKGVL